MNFLILCHVKLAVMVNTRAHTPNRKIWRKKNRSHTHFGTRQNHINSTMKYLMELNVYMLAPPSKRSEWNSILWIIPTIIQSKVTFIIAHALMYGNFHKSKRNCEFIQNKHWICVWSFFHLLQKDQTKNKKPNYFAFAQLHPFDFIIIVVYSWNDACWFFRCSHNRITNVDDSKSDYKTGIWTCNVSYVRVF